MSLSQHTYGPACHLASSFGKLGPKGKGDIPYLKAQFFYSSPLPIDDPLSAVPASTGSDTIKHPPRPFSAQDTKALEAAWQTLILEHDGNKTAKEPTLHGKRQSMSACEDPIGIATEPSARHGESAKQASIGPKRGPGVGDALYEDNSQDNDFSESREAGTTGLPFLKYSSRRGTQEFNRLERQSSEENGTEAESFETESMLGFDCKAYRNTKQFAEVPVGISRLHLVRLPSLQMHPIYWSPVHDIASVIRGTWFYKETMFPVEPAVANQLEMGYRELRPWSQTWMDELNSAVDVGAHGEEKIAHRLWPQAQTDTKKANIKHVPLPPRSLCSAGCLHGEAAAEGTIALDENPKISDKKATAKTYSQYQVIYKDARRAFILKPTLQPSAYYGRRPLQKIKRGMTVGIPVVRGFDWRMWGKCHPSKKSTQATTNVEQMAPVSGDANASKIDACPRCRSEAESPKVTDLVLVIHGIGQKLSERVESFHFTHAINSFRRSVNVELANPAVQRVMRDDLGGVMVLPINWRSNLSFDDGGPLRKGDKDQLASEFSLADLTPKSIPAVRNLISDVMLDIPFYMSHHKPRMIQALITEANRVYRLWCKNNPGFSDQGRVHIIAHSLGSAMAVEVLSKQPTAVPKVELEGKKTNPEYFDFNTTNLFFCGSPVGFFLLLEKGNLVPRRGQKPGVESVDDPEITETAGNFGCLAVDNVYNIMHYNDPIAYRLNATVDPLYAASLKDAEVPSATTGFFESIGNAMRSIAPGISAPPDLAVGEIPKPTVTRLPSQLEMDIHDFTREEIAERKFSLLNDNLQVDWYLSSGGGPLEFQYINMLGAHSSYWQSRDMVRMVVIECGRKPGKRNALPNMRAVKVGHKAK